MNIVITGVSGFVGKHLVRELSVAGHDVIGIGMEKTAHHEIAGLLTEYISCDLAEAWPKTTMPIGAVIHLAGLSVVGPSFDKPQAYISVNSAMVTNMAETYLRSEKKPRLVIVSSGTIYSSSQPMPLTEDSRVLFSSPYVVSKVLIENQAAYYRSQGLDCVVMRPFNHIGPGQLPGFIVPDLFSKIATAARDGVIPVGNLDTRRDYTDVRDVVRAYAIVAVAKKLEHTTYNVCSGRSYSGKELYHLIQGVLHRSDVNYAIDPSLIRPTDIPEIVGDPSRLSKELGWEPTVTIEQTIQDIAQSIN